MNKSEFLRKDDLPEVSQNRRFEDTTEIKDLVGQLTGIFGFTVTQGNRYGILKTM